jgi:hypothetical protein
VGGGGGGGGGGVWGSRQKIAGVCGKLPDVIMGLFFIGKWIYRSGQAWQFPHLPNYAVTGGGAAANTPRAPCLVRLCGRVKREALFSHWLRVNYNQAFTAYYSFKTLIAKVKDTQHLPYVFICFLVFQLIDESQKKMKTKLKYAPPEYSAIAGNQPLPKVCSTSRTSYII